MGLALHWEFRVEADRARAARLVGGLREAAERAGFAEVGPVVEAWAEVHSTGVDEGEVVDRAWALSAGMRDLPSEAEPGAVVRVAPSHVVAFRAASAGTEDAVFGLAQFDPEAAARRGAERGGGVGGVWVGFGVRDAGGGGGAGRPAFVAAHRAVVAVLDAARTLGIKVTAVDDGDFWLTRDPKALLDKLHEWEMLSAALERRRAASNTRTVLRCDVMPRLEANRRVRKDQVQFEELEG